MKRFLSVLILAWSWSAWAQPILRNALTTNSLANVFYDTTTGRLTMGTPATAGPALLTLGGSLGRTNGLYIGTGTIGNGNNLQLWQTNGDSFLSFGKSVGAYSFSIYDNFNAAPLLKLRGSGIADLVGNWRPLNVGPSKVVGTDASTNLVGLTLPAGGLVGGTGTVNTLPKWTATNALGDSTFTDDGSDNFTIGTGTTNSVLTLQIPTNPSGDGESFLFYAGAPGGTDGNGGSIAFNAIDGVGGSGVGGSIDFLAGQGDGGGGNITFTAPGDDTTVEFIAGSMDVILDDTAAAFYPDSTTDLGTSGNPWENLFINGNGSFGGFVTLSGQTNQYTDDGTTLARDGVSFITGGGTAGNLAKFSGSGIEVQNSGITIDGLPDIHITDTNIYPNGTYDLGNSAGASWNNLYLGGYATLSGQTNQYTDNGTQLLRDGQPVGVSLNQNGTNGAPVVNITNSPTVTWQLVGSNWTATAAATGAPATGISPCVTLTYTGTNLTASSIDWNATNVCYTLLLTNNILIGDNAAINVPSTANHKYIELNLIQDGTGGWAVKFTNSIYGGPGGTIALSTNAGSWDDLVLVNSKQTNGNIMCLPSNFLHR